MKRKKRYFRIKGYPDYQITVTGKIHKKAFGVPSGIPIETYLDDKGCRVVELLNWAGVPRVERVEDLMDRSLPKPKKLRPKGGVDQNEFRKLACDPAYEINRLGAVRRIADGKYLQLYFAPGKPTPYYYLSNRRRKHVNTLLFDTFGLGAADVAGYSPSPRELKAMKAKGSAT